MPFIVTTTEQIGECLQQASNDQHAPNSGLPHVQLARGDDVPCIVTTTEKLNECIEACSQNGVRVLPDAVPCIVTTAERLNESIQAASEALEDAHSQNTALSDGEIVIGLHDVLTSCEAVPGMLASWETVPGMDSVPEILDDITGGCIELGMTLA